MDCDVDAISDLSSIMSDDVVKSSKILHPSHPLHHSIHPKKVQSETSTKSTMSETLRKLLADQAEANLPFQIDPQRVTLYENLCETKDLSEEDDELVRTRFIDKISKYDTMKQVNFDMLTTAQLIALNEQISIRNGASDKATVMTNLFSAALGFAEIYLRGQGIKAENLAKNHMDIIIARKEELIDMLVKFENKKTLENVEEGGETPANAYNTGSIGVALTTSLIASFVTGTTIKDASIGGSIFNKFMSTYSAVRSNGSANSTTSIMSLLAALNGIYKKATHADLDDIYE